MLAPTSPGDGDDDDRGNLGGTDLPLRFVRRVVRDEWCCRLEDLVERRLMLLYRPDLSRECLHHLARLMVEHGLLAEHDCDAAVAGCVERLQTHFGKTV
jgi:glycerol-3-phosphate dehydrogenase